MNTYAYTYKDENNNNLKVQYTKAYSDNTEQIHTFWLPSRIIKNNKFNELHEIVKKRIAKDQKLKVKELTLIYYTGEFLWEI